MNPFLLLEKLHGHIGLMAFALCLHPWFALRRAKRPNRAARVSGYLASLFVALCSVLGWVVYPAYRSDVKPELYRVSAFVGDLFEVKEHLAWYALCFAVAGAALMWMARDRTGVALRRPILVTYTITALLTLAVGAIGMYLASVRGFPYAT